MALKQCHNCGAPVSDKAAACPHCGAPVAEGAPASPDNGYTPAPEPLRPEPQGRNINAWAVGLIIFAVAVVLVGGVVIYRNLSGDGSVTQPVEIVDTIAKDTADPTIAPPAKDDTAQRLEQFKAFTSHDLKRHMLHGRVKEMTERLGTVSFTFHFNEQGKITSVTAAGAPARPRMEGSNFVVRLSNGMDAVWSYEGGRLRSWTYTLPHIIDYELMYAFSAYDAQGRPGKAEILTPEVYCAQTQAKVVSLKYSNTDEYGNWLNNGLVSRSIKYYPL